MKAALGFFTLLATPLVAEGNQQTYHCDRQVEVPVVYVTGATDAVVLSIEGRLIYLETTTSASGARYAGPVGTSSYVWWSKRDEASLAWLDVSSGEETLIYESCERQKN